MLLQIGIALMSFEKEEDFNWVLTHLKEALRSKRISLSVAITDRDRALINAWGNVFPEVPILLCHWHANKDVLAYARQHVAPQQKMPNGDVIEGEDTQKFMQAYYNCVAAQTPEDFKAQSDFVAKEWPRMAEYLEKHWWPHKELLVTAWTKHIRHWGHISTSRVEGWHSVLKEWLGSSKSDILGLLEKLMPLWATQFEEFVQKEEAMTETGIPHKLISPLYAGVIRIIHRWPLDQTEVLLIKAREQYFIWKRDPVHYERKECSGIFRQVHGRPCVHELFETLVANETLKQQQFDKRWWANKDDAPEPPRPRLQEPAIRPRNRPRGRGRGGSKAGEGMYGTRREMLHAERVDRNQGRIQSPSQMSSFQTNASSHPPPPPPLSQPIPHPQYTLPPSFQTNQVYFAPPPSSYPNMGVPTISQMSPQPWLAPSVNVNINLPPSSFQPSIMPQIPSPAYPTQQFPPPAQEIPFPRAFKPTRPYQWVQYTSFGTNSSPT